MTCSIVTSVCQVEHNEKMELQGREELSPASWGSYLQHAKEDANVAETLRLSMKPSKQTEDIHLSEVRKLVHRRLAKVLNDLEAKGNKYVDHIDGRVADNEKKKDWKQCGACGVEVPKTKRVCPNKDCQANLKQAEDTAAGKDIFGTMILSPVRQYTYRPKETEILFSINNEQTSI
ncbi:Hypp6886 [Branchiostoma lanceolatum]|uniref:Hypp6886 protein n=1 Tax=Branchiostoma lanceolatum TaxID=7740 RepID=A0A8K0E5U6_BRALA|nr:Hypp6886 [Branchiostoma lanceolatum]